ncbi:calcium-binding protein [Mesorhizobium sp. VNQ89]|uniref:calcium-binding protein n=1 Tax=Mesorhizobium quangtriensis TaxID=3157709 RepID=UPI0032B7E02A
MRKLIIVLAASSVAISGGYSFAQSTDDVAQPSVEAPAGSQNGKFDREPIDLDKFSRMEDLKAADTDGDGILSRAEIEAHALAQLVKRTADRMERRFDFNRDGKVTLEEIEKHKAKRFALLDANDDGQLDRREMRAGKDFRKGGRADDHGPRGHGKRFEQMMQD